MNALQPGPFVRTAVFYHANCPDGFGSAWLLHRFDGWANDDRYSFHPASYDVPIDPALYTDRRVVFVDFCPTQATLDDVTVRATSILVLDHHKTAAELDWSGWHRYNDVEVFCREASPARRIAVIDQEHSGIGIVATIAQTTWAAIRTRSDLVHNSPLVQPWVWNLEDRDLWRFDLPETADVFAAVTSRPYDFHAWDSMPYLTALITEGRAINTYRDRQIQQIADTAFLVLLFGHKVPCVASPYSVGSDVAGELNRRNPDAPFCAYYVDQGDTLRFGLRSGPQGADVSALAAQYGGGGHFHAAGFSIDAWKWVMPIGRQASPDTIDYCRYIAQ